MFVQSNHPSISKSDTSVQTVSTNLSDVSVQTAKFPNGTDVAIQTGASPGVEKPSKFANRRVLLISDKYFFSNEYLPVNFWSGDCDEYPDEEWD